jgi:hypothetical protein
MDRVIAFFIAYAKLSIPALMLAVGFQGLWPLFVAGAVAALMAIFAEV